MELNIEGDNEWEIEEPSLLASAFGPEHSGSKLATLSASSSDEELLLDSRFPRQVFGMSESTDRLAALDPATHTVLSTFSEDIIFTAFLTELRRRCQKQNSDNPFDCVHRMWHNMIHTHCLDFRRKHFKPRQTGIRSLSPELNTFMESHTMTQVLQTIVDLAQDRALRHAATEATDVPKESVSVGVSISAPSLSGSGDAVRRNRWRSGGLVARTPKLSAQLETRFEEYVDLFELCTGIYREIAADTCSHTHTSTSRTRPVTNSHTDSMTLAVPAKGRLGRSFSPVSMLHNAELKSKLMSQPQPMLGSILTQAGDSYRDKDTYGRGSSRAGFSRDKGTRCPFPDDTDFSCTRGGGVRPKVSRGRGRGSSSDSDCDRGRSPF